MSAPIVSEAAFQASVIELAEMLRWRVHHHHDSRRQAGGKLVGDKQAAGFPDLVLARRGRLIFAELKAEKGLVKPEQEAWLDELRATREQVGYANVDVFVWRPCDFEEIRLILR